MSGMVLISRIVPIPIEPIGAGTNPNPRNIKTRIRHEKGGEGERSAPLLAMGLLLGGRMATKGTRLDPTVGF